MFCLICVRISLRSTYFNYTVSIDLLQTSLIDRGVVREENRMGEAVTPALFSRILLKLTYKNRVVDLSRTLPLLFPEHVKKRKQKLSPTPV